MKKLIILTLAFASIFSFNAQQEAPPQGINYQAVAVDNTNKEIVGTDVAAKPVADKEIRVRFSILKTSETGALTYREVHLITTDAYGLFNTVIGQGIQDASPNAFNQIDWGTGYHFLNVEIDITGGTDYKDMGTQQLWSVPYALYSKYADAAGNGIDSVSDNGDGTITFNYIDGSTYTTSPLTGLTGPQGESGPQGPAGPAGADGQDGLSAYEIWLAEGNAGTMTDFLNGIQGPAGPQGPQGPAGVNGQDGLSAYEIWLAEGNTGTEADFLAGITGLQGPQGNQGPAGSQGIQGPVGATGPQGPIGASGANGQDGLSAYEIWLSEGNTGTMTDFLTGITGPQGPQGNQGPAGSQGIQGPVGATGPQGPIGLTGTTGPQGPQGAQGPIGLTGTSGANGSNGLNALVKTTAEPAGANCANGGTKIETGLDADGNGTLDAGEVNASQTNYVCNGGNSSIGNGGFQVITTTGSGTFIVPNSVSTIIVELYGAGGGGGKGGTSTCGSCGYATSGAGGGSGGYKKTILDVIPGQIINYYVGIGGGSAQVGESTTFGSISISGGGAGSNGLGNLTSSTSSCAGVVKPSGGIAGPGGNNGANGLCDNPNGASGASGGNGPAQISAGGSGGAGQGPYTNGNNGFTGGRAAGGGGGSATYRNSSTGAGSISGNGGSGGNGLILLQW